MTPLTAGVIQTTSNDVPATKFASKYERGLLIEAIIKRINEKVKPI